MNVSQRATVFFRVDLSDEATADRVFLLEDTFISRSILQIWPTDFRMFPVHVLTQKNVKEKVSQVRAKIKGWLLSRRQILQQILIELWSCTQQICY